MKCAPLSVGFFNGGAGSQHLKLARASTRQSLSLVGSRRDLLTRISLDAVRRRLVADEWWRSRTAAFFDFSGDFRTTLKRPILKY